MNQETVHPRITRKISTIIETIEAQSGAAFHRNLRRTDFEIAYIRAKYVYGKLLSR